MRKLKFLTFVLFFSITSLFASEKINKANTDIREQIVQLLDDAKFELIDDYKMYLTFTFNSNGEIVVLNITSSNKEIKDFIRKNINYKKLENPGIMNETYTMPIYLKAI